MPVLFLLPLALFLSQASTSKDPLIGDCRRDIDIRNHPRDLLQLRGCRIVDGFLRVVLMDNASPESYANMTFPELRVVTSYVLVMRLTGVRSLGQLFPNLSVIRGFELIMDTYALVVYDMPDLTELDLPKLRNILNGSVSIVKNPRLCFADTIAWDVIAPNGFNTTLRDNQDPLQCLECRCPGQHCWGESSCQDRSPLKSEAVAGGAPSGSPSRPSVRCHDLCVGGCTGPSDSDCVSCAQFEHKSRCVPRCPGHPRNPFTPLKTLGRLCLSEYRCRSTWNGTKFNGACVLECPSGYERVGNQNTSTCNRSRSASTMLICPGMIIRVSNDARLLRGCTIINGSLEIEIASGSNVERDLEIALGSIRKIVGSLIITRSRVLSSLRFLRSLQTIGGQDSNWNISLLVHLNDNLQQLFDGSLTVSSPHGGDAMFFYNPRLCRKEIRNFRVAARLQESAVVEVQNGFMCGTSNLAPLVVSRDSEAVVLAWPGEQGTSAADLLGYAVYHREAAMRNVTEYAGLCADNMDWEDHWVVHEVHLQEGSVNVGHFLLPHLLPATQYAFYVKIYKRSDDEYLRIQYSRIQYFRTLPARPSPPVDVRTADISHGRDGLTVHWDPPMKSNGDLSHYIVIGELQEDDARQLEDRDYCKQPPDSESSASEHGTYSAGVSRHQLDSCPLSEERCEHLMMQTQPQEAACPDALGRCAHALYSIVSEKLKPASLADTAFPAVLPENVPAPGLNFSQLSEPGTHTRSWLRRVVLVVPAVDTSCTVRGLRPFGRYAIEVRACGHKPQEEDEGGAGQAGHPLSALCSTAAWVWGRSPPLADADLVRAPRLTPRPGAIQLNWSEPALPNGLVVSYQIRYENVLANQSQEVCVSRQTYRAQGGELLELAPGAYSIQLRATSLAGRGPWVRAGMVTVDAVSPKSADQGAGHSATLALVIVSILAVMLTVIVILLRRRWRLQREEEDTQRLVEADLADYWDFPWDDWPRPDRVVHFHRDVNDPSDEGQVPTEDKELRALPSNDRQSDSVWCATGVRQAGKRTADSSSVRKKIHQTNPFLQSSMVDLSFTECSTGGRSTNPFLSDVHLDDEFTAASEGLGTVGGQILHDPVGFRTDRSELTSSTNSLNNHSPKLISLIDIEKEYESVLHEENSSTNAECSLSWNIKKGDESEDDCSFESVNLDGENNI